MGGLQGKLLVALVIYFAGFATSIYLQAPALDSTGVLEAQNNEIEEDQQSNRAEVITEKLKTNFREYLSIAEEKASKVGNLMRARRDE